MIRRIFACFVLAFSTFFVRLPSAHADAPGAHTAAVAVLAFDTEDAEEQAEALTRALRSRIRAAPAWSLLETTQALGMLTAAMKCPPKPPPECQEAIGEHIKAERYVWGFVAKGPSPNQVTAEIHLYQRGKSDLVLSETYSENLSEANDDTLGAIAARAIAALERTAVGVVLVHSGEPATEVVVDGEKHVPLVRGAARIELPAGGHAIELSRSLNAQAIKRNVVVEAGHETHVDFKPVVPPGPSPAEKSAKIRKIAGGVAMGAGVILGVVAVASLVHYVDLIHEGQDVAANTPRRDPPVLCRLDSQECARIDSDARNASGLAWGFGAGAVVALGVGATLFFTANTPKSSSPVAPSLTPRGKPESPRLVPTVSRGTGGLSVVGSF